MHKIIHQNQSSLSLPNRARKGLLKASLAVVGFSSAVLLSSASAKDTTLAILFVGEQTSKVTVVGDPNHAKAKEIEEGIDLTKEALKKHGLSIEEADISGIKGQAMLLPTQKIPSALYFKKSPADKVMSRMRIGINNAPAFHVVPAATKLELSAATQPGASTYKKFLTVDARKAETLCFMHERT